MQKKRFIMIVALIVLLSVCIALMLISLLSDQATFGKISGYVAIGGVVVTLVGFVIIIRMNSSTRENREQIKEIEKLLEEERAKANNNE